MGKHKQSKNRTCKECERTIHGTATDIKDHYSLHSFAKRTGLYVATGGIFMGKETAAATACVAEGDRHNGN